DAAGATEAIAALDAMPPTPVRMMEPELLRARAWVSALVGESTLARAFLEEAARMAADSGEATLEAAAWHDVARFGSSGRAADELSRLARVVDGPLMPLRVAHAGALAACDGAGLDVIALEFEQVGALLLAAEASAVAATMHRRDGRAHAASTSAAAAARV